MANLVILLTPLPDSSKIIYRVRKVWVEWTGLHYRVVDTSFIYIDIHLDRWINIYMYLSREINL